GNNVTDFIYQDFAQAYFQNAANANTVADPMLKGISRTTDGGLNPVPKAGSPAMSGAKALADDFFTATSYVGAFGTENWLLGWTALDQLGYVDITTSLVNPTDPSLPTAYELSQNYPNPFNPTTSIRYAVPVNGNVTLSVYNLMGQKVATLVNEFRVAGYHTAQLDGSNLASGVYIYRLEAGNTVMNKKLMLLK
ncbi:T9SS type A sorting domain-containing protein, partial [candidate division KSB1 bacterium]|nr:T9SS type A sorting domain-containing protein [candidate division KSB1 bacterium]